MKFVFGKVRTWASAWLNRYLGRKPRKHAGAGITGGMDFSSIFDFARAAKAAGLEVPDA